MAKHQGESNYPHGLWEAEARLRAVEAAAREAKIKAALAGGTTVYAVADAGISCAPAFGLPVP